MRPISARKISWFLQGKISVIKSLLPSDDLYVTPDCITTMTGYDYDYGVMIGLNITAGLYWTESGRISMTALSGLVCLSAYNVQKLLVHVLLHFTLGRENISATLLI